jgi:hypothetical protein
MEKSPFFPGAGIATKSKVYPRTIKYQPWQVGIGRDKSGLTSRLAQDSQDIQHIQKAKRSVKNILSTNDQWKAKTKFAQYDETQPAAKLRTFGAPRLPLFLAPKLTARSGRYKAADPVRHSLILNHFPLHSPLAKMRFSVYAIALMTSVSSGVLAQDPGPSPTASVGCEPHGDHWFVLS